MDAARQRVAHWAELCSTYVPRHVHLRTATLHDIVHPHTVTVLASSEPRVSGLVEQRARGVYTFPLLREEVCEALLQEMEAFDEFQKAHASAARGFTE